MKNGQVCGSAMKLDYIPIVHVAKGKPKKKSSNFVEMEEEVKKVILEQNAIFEVSKYSVKGIDVIGGNKVILELQLDDTEDGDFIHIDEDSDEMANGTVTEMAYWHVGINKHVIKSEG